MSTNTLSRTVFELDRGMEFFSEKELRMQIGHDVNYWRSAILKELVDNALDACEATDTAPEINVIANDEIIHVSDNGPGISPKIIKKSLDYHVRVSDKSFYVSPTRGQMGNALKTVWAAPFVDSGECQAEIVSKGVRHNIRVDIDRIAQVPKIEHDSERIGTTKGTSIKIEWDSTRRNDSENGHFYNSYDTPPTPEQLINRFWAFNPHARFTVNGSTYDPTVDEWAKWRTSSPTSAHWYSVDTLRDLIAAYITTKKKTVREFVSEFRGLSSTAKQKNIPERFSGLYLNDLVHNGDVSRADVSELLEYMQENSTAPTARRLGIVGEDHVRTWMQKNGIAPDSIKYWKRTRNENGQLPYVIECAFGISTNDEQLRQTITGLNWSPAIGQPADLISDAIGESRLDSFDPVMLWIHLARPRLNFVDRGKTRVEF